MGKEVAMKTMLMTAALLVGVPTALWADVSKDDLKTLASAGVSDTVILEYMQVHGPVAKLSVVDLLELRKAGASERVLAAAVSGAAPDAAPAPPADLTADGEAPPPAAPPAVVYDDVVADPYLVPGYCGPLATFGPGYCGGTWYGGRWYGGHFGHRWDGRVIRPGVGTFGGARFGGSHPVITGHFSGGFGGHGSFGGGHGSFGGGHGSFGGGHGSFGGGHGSFGGGGHGGHR
jgi:hypothetical protein